MAVQSVTIAVSQDNESCVWHRLLQFVGEGFAAHEDGGGEGVGIDAARSDCGDGGTKLARTASLGVHDMPDSLSVDNSAALIVSAGGYGC